MNGLLVNVASVGIIGGKFMERGRIAKPKKAEEDGAPSEYYLAGDLWVGGHVEFNSHRFVLIDCDEYALRYMEAHPAQVQDCIYTTGHAHCNH